MSPCPSSDPPARTCFASVTPRCSWTTSRPARNVGLIGRYGAAWFRGLGTVESPGSTLVSVTGAVERPTVLEVRTRYPATGRSSSPANADPDPQARAARGFGGILARRFAPGCSTHCNEDTRSRERVDRRGGHRGAAAQRVRDRRNPSGGAAGWPTRVRASADPARSVYPRIAEDLRSLLAHPSRDPNERRYMRFEERLDDDRRPRRVPPPRRCGPLRTLGPRDLRSRTPAPTPTPSACAGSRANVPLRDVPPRTRGGTRMGVRRRAGLFRPPGQSNPL